MINILEILKDLIKPKYRILEETINYKKKYYIIQQKFLFWWSNVYLKYIYQKLGNPTIESRFIKWNTEEEARFIINNYNKHKYKNYTIYPCLYGNYTLKFYVYGDSYTYKGAEYIPIGSLEKVKQFIDVKILKDKQVHKDIITKRIIEV